MTGIRFQGRHTEKGFSLLELLVVVAIMAVLFGLAGAAFNQISEGTALATAGDILRADLELAVRDAHARNRTLEVRFYPKANPVAVTIVVPGNGSEAATYPFRISSLPQGVVMEEASEFSSLLRTDGGGVSMGKEPQSAPAPIRGQDYFGFTIRADGRTSLRVADEPWTLMLRRWNGGGGSDRSAADHVTLLVDPLTGAVRSFRP